MPPPKSGGAAYGSVELRGALREGLAAAFDPACARRRALATVGIHTGRCGPHLVSDVGAERRAVLPGPFATGALHIGNAGAKHKRRSRPARECEG